MIIILEGADLTGKTTLATRLASLLQFPVVRPWVHLAHPKPSVISVAKTLHHLFHCVQPDIIYDRFFFSEYVYALVFGREREYVAGLIQEWNNIPGVFLVYLTASDEAIRLRHEERSGDWYVSLAQILAARDAYEELIEILPANISVLTLNTSSLPPDAAAQMVVHWLKDSRQSIPL